VGERRNRGSKSKFQAHFTLGEMGSGREHNASPFGICLRPIDTQDTMPPFHGWEYRPAYLSDPFFMYIGEAGIEEPLWVYLSFMRRVHREQRFIEHAIGTREITGLTLTTPVPLRSNVSQEVIEKWNSHSANGSDISARN
jgi:hypothetical protein